MKLRYNIDSVNQFIKDFKLKSKTNPFRNYEEKTNNTSRNQRRDSKNVTSRKSTLQR